MKHRIFKRSFLVNWFWILTLLFFGNSSYAQINYGSNNGSYITIKNVKIYYEEYGQGIPLILLHGGFGSISHFKNVIEPLSKKYRVIAMDSPGQGRSEQIDSMSYQIYANYYAEFIDNLKLDSVYVLGWSDGGNSAFILAYDRPDKVKKVKQLMEKVNLSHYIGEKLAAKVMEEMDKSIQEYESAGLELEERMSPKSMGFKPVKGVPSPILPSLQQSFPMTNSTICAMVMREGMA
jgi:hypothetical protein